MKSFRLKQQPLLIPYEILIDRNNLFFIVASAVFAYSVRNHELPAFAAPHQSGLCHLPVCSSSVSSSFGRFIFRADRHLTSPPVIFHNHAKNIIYIHKKFVNRNISAVRYTASPRPRSCVWNIQTGYPPPAASFPRWEQTPCRLGGPARSPSIWRCPDL